MNGLLDLKTQDMYLFYEWLSNSRKDLPDHFYKIKSRVFLSWFAFLVNSNQIGFINDLFNHWDLLSVSSRVILECFKDLVSRGIVTLKPKNQIDNFLVCLSYSSDKRVQDVMDIIKELDLDNQEKDRVLRVIKGLNPIELQILKETNYINTLKSELIPSVTKEKQGNSFVKSFLERLNETRLYIESAKTKRSQCQKICTLRPSRQVNFDMGGDEEKIRKGQIDLLFIGEAPGEEEVKQSKPFVGPSGRLLREYINTKLEGFSWVISNSCLCRPPENRTPTRVEIECCNELLFNLIDVVRPRIVVAVGGTAYIALRKFFHNQFPKDLGITKLHGSFEDFATPSGIISKLFVIVHPSFVIRNKPKNIHYFDEGFERLRNHLNSSSSLPTTTSPQSTIKVLYDDSQSSFLFKYPEKYYDVDKYSIVDIQTFEKKILFLWKNIETGTTEFKTIPYQNYYYSISNTAKPVVHSSEVDRNHISNVCLLPSGKWVQSGLGKFSRQETTEYESDVHVTSKCLVDWKLEIERQGKIPRSSPFSYCIVDIEVYVKDGKFPKPEEAFYPVVLCSIYSSLDGSMTVFCWDEFNRELPEQDEVIIELQGKTSEVQYSIRRVGSEEELIRESVKQILKHDVVAAWNSIFDLGYLYTRSNNLNLSPEKLFTKIEGLSPKVDLPKYIFDVPGLVCMDLLTCYKFITPHERESFALGYIAETELGVSKLERGSRFNFVWESDIRYSIKYNVMDVVLCEKINQKLNILEFFNELRFFYCVNWNSVQSSNKALDGLIYYFCKKNGFYVRSKPKKDRRRDLIGGFVHEPVPGLHVVTQFDFSSLYPNIIITGNIDGSLLSMKLKDHDDVLRYIKYVSSDGKEDSEVNVVFFDVDSQTSSERKCLTSQVESYRQEMNGTFLFNGTFFDGRKKSVFSMILEELLSRRKQEKKLLKETKDKQHDLKQRVYKVAANALYGYLGFEGSRFIDPNLVEAVTLTGQMLNKCVSWFTEEYLGSYFTRSSLNEFSVSEDITKSVVTYVVENFYEPTKHIPNRSYIVYGDTDSIFIKSPKVLLNVSEETLEDITRQLRDKFFEFTSLVGKIFIKNQNPRLVLEFEYLGKMFLINAKKRYVVYSTYPEVKLDIKGFDLKRSDYPFFFKESYKKVLEMLLIEGKSIKEIQEFILVKDEESRSLLKKFDPSVGKPVTWVRESYRSITPGVRGMILFNNLFQRVFQEGSKGVLFPIRLLPHYVPQEKLQSYINELSSLTSATLNIQKEVNEARWLTVPWDIDKELLDQILSKLNEWFSISVSEWVQTMWIDKMKDIGLLGRKVVQI